MHGYQFGQQDFIPSSYAISFHGVYALAKITLNWIGPVHSFKYYFSLFQLIMSTVGGTGEGGWKVFSLTLAAKYALRKERKEYCLMPTENVGVSSEQVLMLGYYNNNDDSDDDVSQLLVDQESNLQLLTQR